MASSSALASNDDDATAPPDLVRFLGSAATEQLANQGASQVWAEVTALAQVTPKPSTLNLRP